MGRPQPVRAETPVPVKHRSRRGPRGGITMTVWAGLERLGRGLTGRPSAAPKPWWQTGELPVRHGPDSDRAWREAESVGEGVAATELLIDAAAVLQKTAAAGTDRTELFDLWEIVSYVRDALTFTRHAVVLYAARPEMLIDGGDQEAIRLPLDSVLRLAGLVEAWLDPQTWLAEPDNDDHCGDVDDFDGGAGTTTWGWPSRDASTTDVVGETLSRLAAELRQTAAQGAEVSGRGPLELAVADLVDAVVQIRRDELRAQHAGGQQGRQSAAEAVWQMVDLAQLATNRVVAASGLGTPPDGRHFEGHPEAFDPYAINTRGHERPARPTTSGTANAYQAQDSRPCHAPQTEVTLEPD